MKKTIPKILFKHGSTIAISNWSGRLGNNLMQLSNAIYIAEKCSGKVDYPSHKYIRPEPIEFTSRESEVQYISRFYDRFDCKGIYPELNERRRIIQDFVRERLKFNLDSPLSQDDRALVIQMRSGDMFNNPPPSKYVPSPLSYFQKVIENNGFEHITIVCENHKNPCIQALKKLFPHILIQSSDLESDIRTIVNAKNLCITVGTFGYVLSLLSQKLEHLYVDDIPKEILDFGFFKPENEGCLNFKVHKYRIANYIKFKEWHNTPQQVEAILNHPIGDIQPG